MNCPYLRMGLPWASGWSATLCAAGIAPVSRRWPACSPGHGDVVVGMKPDQHLVLVRAHGVGFHLEPAPDPGPERFLGRRRIISSPVDSGGGVLR